MRGSIGRSRLSVLLAAVLLGAVSAGSAGGGPLPAEPLLVTVDSAGAMANENSQDPSISGDGSLVAFASFADNLVADDTNGFIDVFVRDMTALTTVLVSRATGAAGAQGNFHSSQPTMSKTGDVVAFTSLADNLVKGDTNDASDIFVRSLSSDSTLRLGLNSQGIGVEGDGNSMLPSISADGSHVAFHSDAGNLVPGTDDGYSHVFIGERGESGVELVSVNSSGMKGNAASHGASVSGDGRFVVFVSSASNLGGNVGTWVPGTEPSNIFRRDRLEGITTLVTQGYVPPGQIGIRQPANASSSQPKISEDGRWIVFVSEASNLVPDDTNGAHDVFLYDYESARITRVSVSSAGGQASSSSANPSISGNGRYIAFDSEAHDLVESDLNSERDVFVHDRITGKTTLGSVRSDRVQGNGPSSRGVLSHDGRYLAYLSHAKNLVSPAPNAYQHVFRADRWVLDGEPLDAVIAVAGAGRYATAVEASEEAYPDGLDLAGAKAVVIATGRNWPDALGGSSLAGALDGPILLVAATTVPDVVLEEIDRLGAEKAYIVGGVAAVPASIKTALEAEGLTVERVWGDDRYQTADKVAAMTIKILKEGEGYDGTAFVATGGSYADAVAAAPLAASQGWPLFLAHPTGGVRAHTIAEMGDVTDVLILGGTGAVSAPVEAALADALDPSVTIERLAGDDRYETAAVIAAHGVDHAGLIWNRVGIATGQSYPDALAGGVLQGKVGSVMLLTRTNSLPTHSETALVANKDAIATVTFFGGMGAVSDVVRTAVLQAIE